MDKYKDEPFLVGVTLPKEKEKEILDRLQKYRRPNNIEPFGIPNVKKFINNWDVIYESLKDFYEDSLKIPIESDCIDIVKEFINKDEQLKSKFDYYVKNKNNKEFENLPHHKFFEYEDRRKRLADLTYKLPIFGDNIDEVEEHSGYFNQEDYDYLNFAYDNICIFQVNDIEIHAQVYYNIEATKYFFGRLIPKIKERSDFYENIKNNPIGFKNDVIKTLAVIGMLAYEDRRIIWNIENFQNDNILSKKEFRQYITKLYRRHGFHLKSDYILSNNDDPYVNTIIIGKKTIDKYYTDYTKRMIFRDANYRGFNNADDADEIEVMTDSSDEDAKIAPVKFIPGTKATQSFDLNYNKKHYGLHHVAFPGTYQIDLMFSGTGNNCFLVAIEVNTRYVFVTRTNVKYKIKGEKIRDQKSVFAIYLAMEKLFDQGWNPSIIKSDSERSFISNYITQNVYKKRGIRHQTVFRVADSYNKTQPMHTSLAIIDRFIRTLKKDIYDLGHIQGQLPVNVVNEFVDFYNNVRQHSTLSKILKTSTTPLEVHNDFKKEAIIIRNRIKKNNEIMKRKGWHIPKGALVKVYQGDNKFYKYGAVRPEKHIVVDNLRNIYKIENPRTQKQELISRINIARD